MLSLLLPLLLQFAKLYLYAGACAVADCPLVSCAALRRFLCPPNAKRNQAMTNGGAKLADEADADTRARCFERLTTRDPAIACSSGQWMTGARCAG